MENKNGFENFEELVLKVLNSEFDIGLEQNITFSVTGRKFVFGLADLKREYFVEIVDSYNSKIRGQVRDNVNSRYQYLRRARPNKNSDLIIVFAENLSASDKRFFDKELEPIGSKKPIFYDGNDIINLAEKHKIKYVKHANVNPESYTEYNKDGSSTKPPPASPPPPPGLNEEGEEKTASGQEKINTGSATKATLTAKEPFPNELLIDGLDKIYYGKELGEELKLFDIFILPKAAYGGIGKNGISHRVLEILGIKKDSIEFDNNDRDVAKYKWVKKRIGNKFYLIGFVITRDFKKEPQDFTDHLLRCVQELRNLDYFNEIKERQVNFFIPLLGAGQAGLKPLESLNIIIKGVQLLRSITPLCKIRINLPTDSSKNDLEDYLKYLGNALSGPPSPPNSFDSNFSKNDNNSNNTITDLQNARDKISFRLDQVVETDKLGREQLASEFVNLVKSDIFRKDLKHSFMVHLQGEWGEGKSSFLNFIKKYLHKGDDYWLVVEYNAWQNQNIDPPWWSFLDQLYTQAINKIPPRINHRLYFREKLRRFIKYKSFSQFINLALVSLFILLLVKIYPSIVDVNSLSDSNNSNGTSKITLYLINLLTGVGVVIGLFYSLAKFISNPFFISSQDSAKSFLQYASDPMQKLKKHFNSIIEDINYTGFEVAIFIDDLDRCDKEFIVKLLEGIQTLFKDKRVLYVVAADKKWITTSFGKVYEDFSPINSDCNRLGEFFLEKAFQMSFRVPKISEQAKQDFWNYLINNRTESIKMKKTIDDLTFEEQNELIEDLSNTEEDIADPKIMREKEKARNISPEILTSAVLRIKNKDSEEEKHLLDSFHEFLDDNPRSIIRLANNFTMTRNILITERNMFDKRKIFRWLAIESLFPQIINEVKKASDIKTVLDFINGINDIDKKEKCIQLLLDQDQKNGGSLTIQEIKTIKGL